MLYAEILIGPPGSGKSTYARYKKDVLKDRNIITINLDPGNNKTDFDYDIKEISNTKDFMSKNDLGPHFSVKKILQLFLDKYDNFKQIFNEQENAYLIIDFPGQIEFLISDDTLKKFTKKLIKEGVFVVAVHLVDIVFFIEKHMLLSTYLMTTIAMILLELPHVCIALKCDNIKNYEKIKIDDILNVKNMDINEKNTFYKNIIEMVENESLINFEILDYDNIDTLMYLQMVIDKASGYFYNEEPSYEFIDKENFIEHYSK